MWNTLPPLTPIHFSSIEKEALFALAFLSTILHNRGFSRSVDIVAWIFFGLDCLSLVLYFSCWLRQYLQSRKPYDETQDSGDLKKHKRPWIIDFCDDFLTDFPIMIICMIYFVISKDYLTIILTAFALYKMVKHTFLFMRKSL